MEIDKLLAAKFIREVKYLNWLANMVVAPKKNGKWRVCVNYTNLNDIYSKDNFLLPHIDQIFNATARHGMFTFLDVFFEYHQIPMFQPNEEKTIFITPQGLYCYKVMLFGLKNVDASYQRLMTKMFNSLIS